MFSEAMAWRIEIWPIEKLIPYARNPRTRSDAQVLQIAASIAEFGLVNPVLVDSDAGMRSISRKQTMRELRGRSGL